MRRGLGQGPLHPRQQDGLDSCAALPLVSRHSQPLRYSGLVPSALPLGRGVRVEAGRAPRLTTTVRKRCSWLTHPSPTGGFDRLSAPCTCKIAGQSRRRQAVHQGQGLSAIRRERDVISSRASRTPPTRTMKLSIIGTGIVELPSRLRTLTTERSIGHAANEAHERKRWTALGSSICEVLGRARVHADAGRSWADVVKIEAACGRRHVVSRPSMLQGRRHISAPSIAGKRGHGARLSRAEGAPCSKAWPDGADVLGGNFRTGTLERWGLGYELGRRAFRG